MKNLLFVILTLALIVHGVHINPYLNEKLNQVKELLQNENYDDATNLMTKLCKFASDNAHDNTLPNLQSKLDAMHKIAIVKEIAQLKKTSNADEIVSLLSNLKLVAEQNKFPEALPLLESKLQKVVQEELEKIDELTKKGHQVESIFALSDLYYLAKNNLPELVNSLNAELDSSRWSFVVKILRVDLLDDIKKESLKVFVDELLPDWSDISPRTELTIRDDIDKFFRQQILDMMLRQASDPGIFIKAYVVGGGICSLFKHPNDPSSDLDLSNKEIKFAKAAYLLGAFQYANRIDILKLDREQIALIRMYQVCNSFQKYPLDSNKRKNFIFQLLSERSSSDLEIISQIPYDPHDAHSVCFMINRHIDNHQIFDQNVLSSETKGYFFDECIDDIGTIWKQNYHQNLEQFVESTFVENWANKIEKFVGLHSPQFEDKLEFYDSLIANTIHYSTRSYVKDLLNPKTNGNFDRYLSTSIEQMHPSHEINFENGKKLCHAFHPGSSLVDPIYIMDRLLRYWSSSGHRMSGKLFNKTLNPMSYVYLQATCDHIEDKYLQKELDLKIKKFRQILQAGHHEDAIMVYANLYDIASSENIEPFLDELLAEFQSIKWKVSDQFLKKLFNEAKIIDNLVLAQDTNGALAILSHLYNLTDEEDEEDETILDILDSKYYPISTVVNELSKISIMGQGEESILNLADLYHSVIVLDGMDQFLPLIRTYFHNIQSKTDLLSSALLNADDKHHYVFNYMLITDRPIFNARNESRTNEYADLIFRNLLKDNLMSVPDQDSGSLIKAFVDGSGFCSTFDYPQNTTNDVDWDNHSDVKFAKATFLFGELQELSSYNIIAKSYKTKALKQMLIFCRQFRKHPLDVEQRKIFLTLLLDGSTDSKSLPISNFGSYDAKSSVSVCMKLYPIILNGTFEIIFPTEEARGYFLDECADDLGTIWYQNLQSDIYWRTFKLSLIDRWISQIQLFVQKEMPELKGSENLALIDSLILTETSSVLSNLLDPRQNKIFGNYLQKVVSNVRDKDAELAHYNGTGICKMFEINSQQVNKILGAMKIYWNRGHQMHASLFRGKFSSIDIIYLRAVCKNLEASVLQ